MKKFNAYYLYDRKNLLPDDLVLGIDEVGRGCWAGPLVVCGVILKPNYYNQAIRDSKLTPSIERDSLSAAIIDNALAYLILEASAEEVDDLGPKKTTVKLMTKIVDLLGDKVQKILVDYEKINRPRRLVASIVKGDRISYSIAAASLVAKVYRDQLMIKLDAKYPHYGFKTNKGYGTKAHLRNLQKFGPIKKIHRFSYAPIKKLITPV